MSDEERVDPEAWVDRHGDVLYRYALFRLRTPDRAADVVQETFLEALRARESFAGRASDLLTDFLLVLNAHDRLDVLRGLARVYNQLFDRGQNRMQVQVRSAVPLADDQRERIAGELRVAFGKDPVLHARVEPALLGGLVVQVDDWVYDASVRTRLEMIRKQLVERSSHAIQSGRDRFSSTA